MHWYVRGGLRPEKQSNGLSGGPGGETPAVDDLTAQVVDAFPHGIVVTGESGAVIMSNLEAGRLLALDAVRAEDGIVTCCQIFGCDREGGPLAGRCLTRDAVVSRKRTPETLIALHRDLPESRVGLHNGRRVEAVWVTAAPLGERDVAVFHVRPVERRANGSTQAGATERLLFNTLGRLTIEGPDGPVGGSWLTQRPGQVLKLLLSLRHRIVHPEEIAEALWPEGDRGTATNVHYHVHLLRDHLEPDRERRQPSSYLLLARGGYLIDRRLIEVDADVFERDVTAGLAARAAGDGDLAVARLESAMRLYRGDFLADEPYAEWAFDERDRLRDRAAEALRALEEIHSAAGDLDAAGAAMLRLADLDRYDFDVQRRLCALSLARGRRSEAVRRYRTFSARMQKEFGEELPFTLADLAAARTAPTAE
jgi:DNA-binding SARP family transcriptional activator